MRHEASSESGKINNSMQFRPIEVHQALNRHAGSNLMPWLGLQARHTLPVTYTITNCVVLTRAFIMICSSCTVGIRCWGKADIVCLQYVTDFTWELAGHRFRR